MHAQTVAFPDLRGDCCGLGQVRLRVVVLLAPCRALRRGQMQKAEHLRMQCVLAARPSGSSELVDPSGENP
ncbi:MAG: hypothetical protein ACRDSI_14685 [Pseudonocardiaceae bacterium]